MSRVRLKFAFLPAKVGGQIIWLKQYWVEDIQCFVETLFGFRLQWVEASRAERFDEL